MQLGILKAPIPIHIATIQSQICAARKDPVQCRPKSGQSALACSCREPWRHHSLNGTSLALGTSGHLFSLLRSRARVDVFIPQPI
jgi:hypothetical protein